jgi:hypothetical protein
MTTSRANGFRSPGPITSEIFTVASLYFTSRKHGTGNISTTKRTPEVVEKKEERKMRTQPDYPSNPGNPLSDSAQDRFRPWNRK